MSNAAGIFLNNRIEIDSSFDAARSYAETTVTSATAFLNKLTNAFDNVTAPEVTPAWTATPTAPPVYAPDAPVLTEITFTSPDKPDVFSGELDISAWLPEAFDETPPSISIPGLPGFSGTPPTAPNISPYLPSEFSGTAPSFSAPTLPDFDATEPLSVTLPLFPEDDTGAAPELTIGAVPTFARRTFTPPTIDPLTLPSEPDTPLPSRPSLLSLNVRQFDGITIPEFDEEVPELTLVAPTVMNYEPDAPYSSALLTLLKQTLHDRIDIGGTGLSADVEQAIWDRGREREAIATREALDALDSFEAMGFAMPPGAYIDQRAKVHTELAYRQFGLNREIIIKQAELELDNVKSAIEQANVLEGRLIDYQNQIEQRAFEAVRYVTEAGIAVYNARVQAYSAYLDAYKTKVLVYEAQIRGLLATVDAYKAEVDAELAKAQVNQALVDAYRAEIEGALAVVRIYEASVNAVRAKAEVERLKIDIYGAEIQAYATEANAYAAEVSGFEAGVRGQVARVDAYRGKVSAFASKVDAAASEAQAKVGIYGSYVDRYRADAQVYGAKVDGTRALVDIERARQDAFQSTVQAYLAYVEGRTGTANALTAGYSAEVSGFRGTVDAYSALTDGYRAGLQAQTAAVDVYRAKADAYSAVTRGRSDAVRGLVDAYTGEVQAKTAEWQGYEAEVRAEAAKASAIASENSSVVDAYRAASQAAISVNDVLTKQWQVAVDQAQRVTEIGVATAKANAELYISARTMALEAAKVGAQVSAQLAASALNAVNFGYSFSEGNSYSFSQQESDSTSRNEESSDVHYHSYDGDSLHHWRSYYDAING